MDISLKLVVYQAINFVVLMVFLGWLFNKFIRPFMRKRSEEIKQSFAEAETRKKEADTIRQEATNQLVEMKNLTRQTLDKAVEDGNALREEIMAQADKDRVDLLEKARKEIEHEKQKAILEIQKEVANLSIMAAGRILKKEVDNQSNRALVYDFLKEIESDPSSGKGS
jgi:F-type H+-transporting ATPase subunit b